MDMKRIKELSKALTETQDKPESKIMYGTVISADTDGVIVQLEGADVGIPVNATIEVHENDRVMVQFNDHEASIIGNVSDKSITRTTAEGLIDLYAHGAILYGNNEKIILQLNDSIEMINSEPDSDYDLLHLQNCYTVEGESGEYTFDMRVNGYGIICTDSRDQTSLINIQFGQGGIWIDTTNAIELNTTYLAIAGETHATGRIYADGGITLPNNKALRALNTSDEEKNLIYLNTADNVIINGNSSGTTYIVSDTSVSGGVSASGNIVSTGGFLSSNNCTSPSGGVSGGYINANGRCVLVGADSSNYPQVVFVTSKSTSRSTTLRSNNTSGTYTLTLPNSTGTLAVSSSDIRLKENIKDSEVSGLDLINKIKLHEFDWKAKAREGAPHWKIGMIADELEQLDENLVFGGGANEDGSMNVKGIETTCLISYLVKAVQELSAEVKALRGENDVK